MFKNFPITLLIATCFAVSAVYPAQANSEPPESKDDSEICQEQSDPSEPSEPAAEGKEEDDFGCMLLSVAGAGFPELGAVDDEAGLVSPDSSGGSGGSNPGGGGSEGGGSGNGGSKDESPGTSGGENSGAGGTKDESPGVADPGNPNSGEPEGLVSGNGATVIPTPALLPGLIGFGIGAYRKHKARTTDA